MSVSESQKLEYPVNAEGVAAIHFYQGEEEIEKYIADDFSYILTSDYMLYPVMPIQMEFRGAELGDTDYITGFLSRFGAKVRERYAVEEILESISDAGHLEDLKKLLENTINFEGAYDIKEGYQFIFSETGYADYFG